MRKAQGALEYLIIIAAVLAIAAIVVLFLTGAFKGATGGGDIAKCKLAAANCASGNATGVYTTPSQCQKTCMPACSTTAGNDVMAPAVAINAVNCLPGAGTPATACISCILGNAVSVHAQ